MFNFGEVSEDEEESASRDDEFLAEIQQHSTEPLEAPELKDRLEHPEKYENLDKIESV